METGRMCTGRREAYGTRGREERRRERVRGEGGMSGEDEREAREGRGKRG